MNPDCLFHRDTNQNYIKILLMNLLTMKQFIFAHFASFLKNIEITFQMNLQQKPQQTKIQSKQPQSPITQPIMTDLQIIAEQKISQLLSAVYSKLSKHPQVTDEQRQLLPAEEELMQNLDQSGFYYQSLLRSLAIDSYTTAIERGCVLVEELCGMLTAALQFVNEMGESVRRNGERKEITERYNRAAECLVQCIKISQQMHPKNPYIDDQNKLIQSLPIPKRIEQTLIQKLRSQNKLLLQKSESNEAQITNMEHKLTRLLKQHQYQDGEKMVGSKLSNIELREEIVMKDAEIERMNEEFSFEIEKYNTVFQAMKRELEEMKGYQNIDLIEQIELLETEIVRLREERDRDQIIIRQLRNDNMAFSSMGMGAGYYPSSRESVRYHNSRYQY